MKKSWLIRALLLTAYCVPFAFFSVKGDITSGTMVYYGVMIVSFVILYRCALKTDNVPIIFIGNILSFISSYLTAKLSQLDPMEWYCKPFTSHSLIVAISVASLIIHRSSYGEEAESRGTHRGVTEHEETQKSDDRTADRSPVRYDIGLHFFPSFCFTQVRGAGGVCR